MGFFIFFFLEKLNFLICLNLIDLLNISLFLEEYSMRSDVIGDGGSPYDSIWQPMATLGKCTTVYGSQWQLLVSVQQYMAADGNS